MSGLSEINLPAEIDKPCDICCVSRHGVCGALSRDQLAEFDRIAKRAAYAPKETLFSQGEPATKVFNVCDGVVRLYKLLPDGRRQVIGFKSPGDFIGLAAGANHGLGADAISAVSLCWFSKQGFLRFAEDKLALMRRLNELANRELCRAHDRMLLLGRFSAEEKIASFIVDWRDRLAALPDDSDNVSLPMSRRDIADYLGLTIETVSRTFTKLECDGLLAVTLGSVRILDAQRIENLAVARAPN